jgi:hypothetical protein
MARGYNGFRENRKSIEYTSSGAVPILPEQTAGRNIALLQAHGKHHSANIPPLITMADPLRLTNGTFRITTDEI